jgi:hypothetical protein
VVERRSGDTPAGLTEGLLRRADDPSTRRVLRKIIAAVSQHPVVKHAADRLD